MGARRGVCVWGVGLLDGWGEVSGVENVVVAVLGFDVAFDLGGLGSGGAGAGAVFDVVDVAEDVLAFRFVVACAGAVGLGEERGHAEGAS